MKINLRKKIINIFSNQISLTFASENKNKLKTHKSTLILFIHGGLLHLILVNTLYLSLSTLSTLSTFLLLSYTHCTIHSCFHFAGVVHNVVIPFTLVFIFFYVSLVLFIFFLNVSSMLAFIYFILLSIIFSSILCKDELLSTYPSKNFSSSTES